MASSQRAVLITGCSDNSLGAALAIEFQKAGLQVYATARDTTRLKQVSAAGCQTLTLDVTSQTSIEACIAQVPKLDILVNNAGAGYTMPVADLSITEAKKLFDLNVWAPVAVTQACLPLLIASQGLIANNTSIGSLITVPFQAAYGASKAAMSMISNCMRLEFAPFGIKVVELKTGSVQSNLVSKMSTEASGAVLPEHSIYAPVREEVQQVLRGEWIHSRESRAEDWAKLVVADLLRMYPPLVSWRGSGAGTVRLLSMLPTGSLDGTVRKMTTLDVIEKKLKEKQQNSTS